jgi:hypothetical protein
MNAAIKPLMIQPLQNRVADILGTPGIFVQRF